MKKVLLILLCVISISALGYGVYYKFLYEESKEYKDYKEYRGYFGVGTENFTKNYSNGDEIKVGPGWEYSSNDDYVYLEFKVKSSEGLEFIKEDFYDGYVASYDKKKNKYMLNLKNAVVVQSGIDFIYKVTDENKDLNVKFYDIYFKNKEGKLFKVEDEVVSLVEKGIVYKCNYKETLYRTGDDLKLKWFTNYDYSKDNSSVYNCEEHDLGIEKGYSIVSGVYSNNKVLLYKNKRYYLYDIYKKEFILETEELKDFDDGWSNPLLGYSYIDKNEKDKNAYGVSIYGLNLYINLDKNEVYYDFISGDNRIVYNNGYSNDFSYTDGKLIKIEKKEDTSSFKFGFFNGENFTLLDKNYTSCIYNYLYSDNYTILCHKDFIHSQGYQKLTLFDMKGNIIFDSDKYISYFDNPLDNIIIYKERESNINRLNMIDNRGNLIAYIDDSDGTFSNDTFDHTRLEPYIFMIGEEDIDKCFDYYSDEKYSDYLVVRGENIKLFKYNGSNKTYQYLKDMEECSYNNYER